MKQILPAVFIAIITTGVHATDAFYCPQKHGYVKIGMTQDQVMNTCGPPSLKQEVTQPVTQKVPVTQLIYNHQGTNKAFYGVWELPIGNGGARLEVDVVNEKVYSVRMNSNSTTSFSVCDGQNINVGDPASSVYDFCGNPSIVNQTFINRVVPGDHKVERWIYKSDQFQSSFSLTFINGKLKSINQ